MTKNIISKKIEQHQSRIKDDTRDYIGASIIGSECLRQIWYEFKGFESKGVAAKTRRTWDIGKRLETLVIDWIESSGLELSRGWVDFSSRNVPIFCGHVDAILTSEGQEHSILEIKTAKNSSFNLFVNKGLKEWAPQYYAQIQSYMGMSDLFSAYIFVLNKDNSEISDELVTFDEQFYKSLEEKALMIAESPFEPPRISNSPIWYTCKMCRFNKVCHI